MKKFIVITGVSTGIGFDAARLLGERGFHVFGSVRKAADAAAVSQALGVSFTPLLFDVTDEVAIAKAADQVRDAVGEAGLFGLVNNAGIATFGPLQHLPLAKLRQQLEVNVVGVTAVTQAFLPLLGATTDATHLPGRIVNISSVSGKIAYPFLGAYAASKHALEALSDAWRRELLLFGIDVILIEPGTVQTPIIGKSKDQIEEFLGTAYGRLLEPLTQQVNQRESNNIPVEKISEIINTALTARRPKTRYAVPRRRLTGWLLPRLLPDRWLDRVIKRRLRL